MASLTAQRKALKKKLNAKLKAGTVPRYLRALHEAPFGYAQHFVEWHDCNPSQLTKERSYTQLCVYEDLGKVPHNSETDTSLKKRIEKGKGNELEKQEETTCIDIMHGWNKRISKSVEGYKFAKVVNEGSTEFKELGLDYAASRIDFVKLALKVLADAPLADKNRGNMQLNLLFSGGENNRREETELEEHYGCAMPHINKGSESFQGLAVELSSIAKKVGIPWAGEKTNQELEERNRMFANTIHKENIFEGITIAVLQLFPVSGKVKEHTDKLNCGVYTHTVLFCQIVCIEGKIYRVAVIGYMRKSCHDAIIRRKACKELAEDTEAFLRQLSSHQIPKMEVEENIDFYRKAGGMGLGIIVRRPCNREEKLEITGAGLLNHPHMDKAMSYISPLASAMLKIYDANHWMTFKELFLMALPLGFLNGVFTYGCVLNKMIETGVEECPRPLGILEKLVDEVKAISGSFVGGGFVRSKVSWQTKVLNVQRTLADVRFIEDMCMKSSESPPVGMSYEVYCREKSYEYIGDLKKVVYGVGDFGAVHLMHGLVHLGLLKPEGLVHHSKFAVKTATLKDSKVTQETPNPCMVTYLNGGASGPVARAEKGKRIMESVQPYLKRKYQPWVTSQVLEQSNCEQYRSKLVVDFIFPGGTNLFMSPLSNPAKPGMWEMRPQFDSGKCCVEMVWQRRARPLPRVMEGRGVGHVILETDTVSIVEDPTTDFVYCRIPLAYLECYTGLWNDVLKQFFPVVSPGQEKSTPSMTKINAWLANHPIISGLIHHFIKNPSRTKAAKRGHGSTHLINPSKRQKKTRLVPADFASLAPHLFDSRFEQYSDHGDSSEGYSSEECDQGVEECEATNICQRNEEENFRMSESKVVSMSLVSDSFKGCTGEEFHPKLCGQIPVLYQASFGHYQFENQAMLASIIRKPSVGTITTKKLDILCKAQMAMSPVLSEVKRSLFYGTAENKLPVLLNKKALRDIPCTNATYKWSAWKGSSLASGAPTPKYHMVEWKHCPHLPFFTVGQCIVADSIAELTGGVKGYHKNITGLCHWMFPSYSVSIRYLARCLILLGGKPGYFKRLYQKVSKRVGESSKTGAAPIAVALQAGNETDPLFYVLDDFENHIISSGGKSEFNWVVVIPNDVKDPKESRNPLVVDPLSWKDLNNMVPRDLDIDTWNMPPPKWRSQTDGTVSTDDSLDIHPLEPPLSNGNHSCPVEIYLGNDEVEYGIV